jgi:predicted Fe-Mo cluster-binding NifX family protein
MSENAIIQARRFVTLMMPLDKGRLSQHFGRCEAFAYVTADEATGTVLSISELSRPPHYPGLLPHWVMEEGADIVIAGGMGRKAQEILAALGVEVIVGAPESSPETVASMYLDGRLVAGPNACQHCEYSVVVKAGIPASNMRSDRLDDLEGCA